jgi:hypothetical protein
MFSDPNFSIPDPGSKRFRKLSKTDYQYVLLEFSQCRKYKDRSSLFKAGTFWGASEEASVDVSSYSHSDDNASSGHLFGWDDSGGGGGVLLLLLTHTRGQTAPHQVAYRVHILL